MELISVIVPIYGVEAYLDQCVASLVGQTYKNLEILLVDDGSPDRCPALCDAWAEQDHRIRVLHKSNGGLSDARNAGLAAASGTLIAFVDGDDTVEPEFLETLYARLTETGADIVECGTRLVNEAGETLALRGPAQPELLEKRKALVRLVLEDGVYQTVWNKLYRRKVLAEIPFETGKYHEDDFWTYQVFDRANALALTPPHLYRYLQRGGSIMDVGFSLRRLDGLTARLRRMEYLQKYPELACLTRQQLALDCIWYLQSALRRLRGPEQAEAVSVIRQCIAATPPVPRKQLTLNRKYRLWYAIFTTAPMCTARLRNLLKIGL